MFIRNGYPDPEYLDQLGKELETLASRSGKSLSDPLKKSEDQTTNQPMHENTHRQLSGKLKSFVHNDLEGVGGQGTLTLVFEFSAGQDEVGVFMYQPTYILCLFKHGACFLFFTDTHNIIQLLVWHVVILGLYRNVSYIMTFFSSTCRVDMSTKPNRSQPTCQTLKRADG